MICHVWRIKQIVGMFLVYQGLYCAPAGDHQPQLLVESFSCCAWRMTVPMLTMARIWCLYHLISKVQHHWWFVVMMLIISVHCETVLPFIQPRVHPNPCCDMFRISSKCTSTWGKSMVFGAQQLSMGIAHLVLALTNRPGLPLRSENTCPTYEGWHQMMSILEASTMFFERWSPIKHLTKIWHDCKWAYSVTQWHIQKGNLVSYNEPCNL